MSTAPAAAPPKAPSATQQIIDKIDGLGTRLEAVEQRQTAADGLYKALEAPASRAGVSPAELLAKHTQGGRVPGVVASDGTWLPAGTVAGGQFQPFVGCAKSLGGGFGEYAKLLAEMCLYGANAPEGVREKLFAPREKGGFGVTKAALAEGSGTTGGYTVPPQFVSELLRLALEEMTIPERARVLPMESLTLQVPSLDVTTAQTAGTTPFLGGVLASWTAESATRAESEPAFRQTELKAHELSFYAVAGRPLLADNAVVLDTVLTTIFSQAIGWYREYAYLRGTGVGQPLGVLNAPALLSFNRNTSSKIVYIDVATMYAKIYAPLLKSGRLAWHAHQSAIPQLLYMNDDTASSQKGRLVFQSIDQGATKPPQWYLFGLPIFFTEKLPALGTKGDIILCDWSQYLLGDRQALEMDVSPHVNFLKNQMTYRVVWRGDGQPWLNNSITLADGSQTVSAFTCLNT